MSTKAKIDLGKKAYEAELAEQPNYTATGKPRPLWKELPEHVQNSWRKKVMDWNSDDA